MLAALLFGSTGVGILVLLAFAGIGHRGLDMLKTFAATNLTSVAALCDVDLDASHTREARELFPAAPRFRDCRAMLDQAGGTIDAVVISTPDHTHFPLAMHAMAAGKLAAEMIDKHEQYAREAAAQGAQVICFQELFYGPYFCQVQEAEYYDYTEYIPDGPTTKRFQALAKELNMVMVLPMYEIEQPGVYYNTAAVIDADGSYLGKFRKQHIPQVKGFWEKFYFRPGNGGYPVFDTAVGKVGVYICYDRHFPEGARALGLGGAEIVFNPSATVAGLSQYLWKLEQPAHAVANGYFVGAINRVCDPTDLALTADDVAAVVAAAGGRPVKVIIETPFLTAGQKAAAARLHDLELGAQPAIDHIAICGIKVTGQGPSEQSHLPIPSQASSGAPSPGARAPAGHPISGGSAGR